MAVPRSRFHLLLVVGVLAVGLGGVALAQAALSSSAQVKVTLLDGKLKISETSVAAGVLTLVATNDGKLTHGLGIAGTGLTVRRTPVLASGKTARLVVTVKAGMYRLWDSVRSNPSQGAMLMVKSAARAGTTGSTAGGKAVSGGSSGAGSGYSGTPTISGGGSGTMPGMDPNDPCAGM
jgi:hypothetical protein